MNNELLQLLKQAISTFYDTDIDLVIRGGMEQACVFRIGLYLNDSIRRHDQFKHLNLDCEYNKSTHGIKKINNLSVRPDLIIHQRNFDANSINDNNTLIVEFKGWWKRYLFRRL